MGSRSENAVCRGHGQARACCVAERTGRFLFVILDAMLPIIFVQNGTLLIGTSTCEIVTVDMTAPGTAPTVRCQSVTLSCFLLFHRDQVHLHSHSGAVTGLCVSPLENCAVTVSCHFVTSSFLVVISYVRSERIVRCVFGTWSSDAWMQLSTWACDAGAFMSALMGVSML